MTFYLTMLKYKSPKNKDILLNNCCSRRQGFPTQGNNEFSENEERQGQKAEGEEGYHIYSPCGHRQLGTRGWLERAPCPASSLLRCLGLILQEHWVSTALSPLSWPWTPAPLLPCSRRNSGWIPGDWRTPD